MIFGGEILPALRNDIILPAPERLVFGDRFLEHAIPFSKQ
jgi:hypothetical protein